MFNSVLLLALCAAGSPIGESVVVGQASNEHRVPTERAQTRPEETLDQRPEVTFLRTGGPLAPARVTMRGFGGPRLDTRIGGLSLGGPSSGDIDIGLLPWVGIAATVVTPGATSGSMGGRLSFEPIDASWPRATARLALGAQQTLEGGLAAGTPFKNGNIFIAADAGRTDGNFAFQPSSATGQIRPTAVRLNNDQHRAAAMVGGHARVLGLDIDVLALVGAREGGIPGFAAAPTDALRGRRALAGSAVSAGQTFRLMQWQLALKTYASARVEHRATRPAASRSWNAVDASSLAAGFEGQVSQLPWEGRLAMRIDVERLAVANQSFRRTGAHGQVRGSLSPLRFWQIDAELRAAILSDVGALWGGRLSTSVGMRWLRLGASISRAARAPTLNELYAPEGLVLGNPELSPEASNQVETFITSRPGRWLTSRLTIFLSRAENTILYVNRNAFEIAPTNTGGLWQSGAEAALTLRPHTLVGLKTSARWLLSRLDLTGAPLPVTPPVTAFTAFRVGKERGLHAQLQSRARAPSTSNLYGTLPVPGYLLVDLVGRWPIGSHFLLFLSLSNLFDHRSARDLNGLPLPGRQIFAAMEANL